MNGFLVDAATDRVESSRVEEGLRLPLLITSGIKPEDEEECDESEESPEDSHKPANSFIEAYRLLTPSVKVSFITFLKHLLRH